MSSRPRSRLKISDAWADAWADGLRNHVDPVRITMTPRRRQPPWRPQTDLLRRCRAPLRILIVNPSRIGCTFARVQKTCEDIRAVRLSAVRQFPSRYIINTVYNREQWSKTRIDDWSYYVFFGKISSSSFIYAYETEDNYKTLLHFSRYSYYRLYLGFTYQHLNKLLVITI